MTSAIRLSDDLMRDAKHYADVYHRSIPKQVEYWSRIGKIAEENPDLPFSFINEILLAQQELKDGDVTPFNFGS